MGVVEIFDIRVTTKDPVLSGQAVKGEVLLRIKKELEIARLVLYFTGAGQVEFDDSLISTSGNARSGACDRETYMKLTSVLYSRNSSPNSNKIAKNELYELGFEFTLPKNLPSSFMSVIYYKLTAFLDCGGKSHDVSKPVIVINDYHLNDYVGRLALLDPVDSWTPARSKYDTGLISVNLLLNKRGFIIGESLTGQVELFNNSKVKLENINVCLVQKSTMKAFNNAGLQLRRKQRLLVRNLPLGKVRNGERLVNNLKINIPWVVTSDMEQYSRLVEVEYYIQVTTITSVLSALTGTLLNQQICIGPEFKRVEQVHVLAEEQIVIGARPAVSVASNYDNAASGDVANSNNNNNSIAAYPSAPPASDQSDLTMFTMHPTAPPSYNEAMKHEKPSSHASSPAAAAASSATAQPLARSISPSASSDSLTQEAA